MLFLLIHVSVLGGLEPFALLDMFGNQVPYQSFETCIVIICNASDYRINTF